MYSNLTYTLLHGENRDILMLLGCIRIWLMLYWHGEDRNILMLLGCIRIWLMLYWHGEDQNKLMLLGCIQIWLMLYWHGEDRGVLMQQGWVCSQESMRITDYNQKILTIHSIYDSFTLLNAFNTNTIDFLNISKTNYLLINHLICTTPDTEQIIIWILHSLIIQKLKNVIYIK